MRGRTNVVVLNAEGHPLEPEGHHEEGGSLEGSVNAVVCGRRLPVGVRRDNVLPMEHEETADGSHAASNELEQDELLAVQAAEDGELDDLADVAVLLIGGLCA